MSLTKQRAIEIQNDVLAALTEVAKKHNVFFKFAGGSLASAKVRLNLEVNELDEHGVVQTQEAADFIKYAPRFTQLLAEDLGKTFRSGNKTLEIVGFMPNARVNNVLAKDISSQKQFVVPSATVEASLGRVEPSVAAHNAETEKETAKRDFTFLARRYGLDPEDYGKEINVFNKRFRIVGVRPSASKNSISVEDVRTGKQYVMPPNRVKAALTAQSPDNEVN